MAVGLYAAALQALLEGDGGRLSAVVGYHHGANHESPAVVFLAQTDHVFVVCDAEVGALLVLLYVGRVDNDDYFYAVADFLEHPQLAVGQKPWQYAAGVVVVEELSAKLQIQFSVKLRYSLLDVFRLDGLVLLVVKSCFHRYFIDNLPAKLRKINHLCITFAENIAKRSRLTVKRIWQIFIIV